MAETVLKPDASQVAKLELALETWLATVDDVAGLFAGYVDFITLLSIWLIKDPELCYQTAIAEGSRRSIS